MRPSRPGVSRSSPEAAQRCAEGAGLDGDPPGRGTIAHADRCGAASPTRQPTVSAGEPHFFLGEPEAWQIKAQNYGGEGEFLTIRVRGRDLLADPRRKLFYRRGLFWEADRAVVVKGGYEGLARVTPLPL